jgi:hypothetical protein
MTAELPEPPSDGSDVWGAQLNKAIADIAAAVPAVTGDVSITSVDDKGNPILSAGYIGSAAVLLAAAVGSPDGVASLDDAGQLPASQSGNIDYLSVGAAPANHTHALADLPSVALAINATPAMGVFNATTKAWPTRISLTNSATRTVIWWGDAAIPADAVPNVDLFFGPTTTGGTVSTPVVPPPATTTPDPVTGIALAIPTVVVNGSLYNISALFTNGSTARTFTYLQLAVRGPDGTAYDTGYNNNYNAAASATLTLTGSGTAPTTGTYTAKISYNVTGGNTTWVDGPTVSFSITSVGGGVTPPPAGDTGHRTIPLIGRSGLAWNSGVFFNAGNVSSANSFATWRGRKLDSIMYFTGRSQYSDMNYLNPGLTSWPGYRIISLPSQPAGQSNFGTASTGINFWTQWGLNAKNAGWNDGRTIVRLNWEANGNWYNWAWQNGGASLFVQTYQSAVNAIRSNAPKMLFDLTMNRGNVNGGVTWQTQIFNPLLNYFDIIGLDWYDDFPSQATTSGFNSALANDPGPTSIASYCRTNGKMLWLNEWGLSHRKDGPSGGDDPAYMLSMWNWQVANADVMAGETYYEDNGTNGQLGRISDGTNPNGAAVYKSTSHWGGTGA